MKYKEEHRDLFAVSEDYYLAHCIASDIRLGAGIAVPMQKKFGLIAKLQHSGESLNNPTCVLVDRVFNLITKARSSGKPTYQSLQQSLLRMSEIVEEKGIKKIAMPKIGCGLDRLQWGSVRQMLHEIFDGLDVEILVCFWP